MIEVIAFLAMQKSACGRRRRPRPSDRLTRRPTSCGRRLQVDGFALAFRVLVDAFLVRMTLVPAVLALLDRRA
jgi:hypothetical protein